MIHKPEKIGLLSSTSKKPVSTVVCVATPSGSMREASGRWKCSPPLHQPPVAETLMIPISGKNMSYIVHLNSIEIQ